NARIRAARPARIRAFAILNEDFSVENGELTPTLKLRRAVVGERYAAEIDALYERGDKSSSEGSGVSDGSDGSEMSDKAR
ncbi:hypothetical protein, partial [Streptomyces alboverticillatus]|uniref:hypothetical protein n=1 Tax=Streptomyces alboverticillatus TaxID=173770 RepID=UPI0011816733